MFRTLLKSTFRKNSKLLDSFFKSSHFNTIPESSNNLNAIDIPKQSSKKSRYKNKSPVLRYGRYISFISLLGFTIKSQFEESNVEDKTRNSNKALKPIASQKKETLVVKNIVFQGGGPKAIAYVGALLALEEELGSLQEIEQVAGTSAGAITATLLAVGYNPKEIDVLLRNTPFSQFLQEEGNEINILNMKLAKAFTNRSYIMRVLYSLGSIVRHPILSYHLLLRFQKERSICSGERFRKWMDDAIASKIAERKGGSKEDYQHLTFGELQALIEEESLQERSTRPYKALYIIGTLLENNGQHVSRPVFSTENVEMGNYIISDAVRISMSIPLVFKPHSVHVKNKEKQRVELETTHAKGLDGGLLDNYPIKIFNKNGYLSQPFARLSPKEEYTNFETLGLVLYDKTVTEPMWRWLFKIVTIYQAQTWEEEIELPQHIKIDIREVTLFDFDMPKERIDILVKSGSSHVKNYFLTEAHRLREFQRTEKVRCIQENEDELEKYATTNLSSLPSYYVIPEDKYMDLKPHIENFEYSALLRLAIVGIGGSGKSELAKYSAHQYSRAHFWHCWRNGTLHNKKPPVVWWMEAATPEIFLGSLIGLAKKLECYAHSEATDPFYDPDKPANHEIQVKNLCAQIQKKLRECSSHLLVLDNVTPVVNDLILDHLNGNNYGRLIITSRNTGANQHDFHVVNLSSGLTTDQAQALLKKLDKARINEDSTKLVEKLEGLPLALFIAGSTLKTKHWISYEAYLKDLEDSKEHPLKTTIRLSVESIEDDHSASSVQKNIALGLLLFCSYLDADNIPKVLLERYFTEQYRHKAIQKDNFEEALGLIMRCGLITEGKNGKYKIHRVTQTNILSHQHEHSPQRSTSYPVLNSEWYDALFIATHLEYSDKGSLPEEVEERQRSLLPHLQSLVRHHEKIFSSQRVAELNLSFILEDIGNTLFLMGDPKGAQPNYERSLIIKEHLHGKDHQETATILTNLGSVHYVLGNVQEARMLLERALKIRELHKEDPQIAITLTALGNTYRTLENPKEAKALLERALEIQEQCEDDLQIAIILTALGVTYSDLGNAREAKALLERALQIKERIFSRRKNHPQIAITLTNLASTYSDLGSATEAKALLKRALKILEQYDKHYEYEIANTLASLGSTYRDLGNAQKAKILLERALKFQERYYGTEHHMIAATLTNLGITYSDLGDANEAKASYKRALKIQEKHYGLEHPKVAITLTFLGSAYRDLADPKNAKKLYKRALQIKEQHYGIDQPEVAITLTCLGSAHLASGNIQEAEVLLKRALKIKEQHFGSEHYMVAVTLTYLGATYSELGYTEEAKIILQRALKIKERYYGMNHPKVGVTLYKLASSHIAINEYDIGCPLVQRCHQIYLKAYGTNHKDTQDTERLLQQCKTSLSNTTVPFSTTPQPLIFSKPVDPIVIDSEVESTLKKDFQKKPKN